MDFIKTLFTMFNEDYNDTASDGKAVTDDQILSSDNTIINTEEGLDLQDILTSQSSSISGPLIDEIASEMLQDIENNNEADLNVLENNNIPSEAAKETPLIDLDDFFNDIQNLDDNSESDNLPDIQPKHKAYSCNTTIEKNDPNEVKKNSDNAKDSEIIKASSFPIINRNNACSDLKVVYSTKDNIDAEKQNNTHMNRGSTLETSTTYLNNILNFKYVSKGVIVNQNVNSVIEKLKTYKDITISKVISHSKDLRKNMNDTEMKDELSKIVNTAEPDTTYVANILNENNNNLTNNDKDDIVTKTNIENNDNINNEKFDDEPKVSIQTTAEIINTNNMSPFTPSISNNLIKVDVKLEDIFDIEFTKDFIEENNPKTKEIIKIESNHQVLDVSFETNAVIINNLSKETTSEEIEAQNTDWEKLNDEIPKEYHISENMNTQNRENTDDKAGIVSISLEKNLQGEALPQNGGEIDTISLHSDRHDSDYCSGYISSDFEFITQSDAEADGFIITVTNKKLKTNSRRNSDAHNAVPAYQDFFAAQNDAGPSNSIVKGNITTAATGNINFDPNKDYSYPNHVRFLPNMEIDNNLEHRIPEGEEYLNLFRGIYSPIMTTEMFFLENKSMGSAKSMDAQNNGLGFDMRRMVMIDDADEECKREAKENYNKILQMYPGANRRRRRRQYFK